MFGLALFQSCLVSLTLIAPFFAIAETAPSEIAPAAAPLRVMSLNLHGYHPMHESPRYVQDVVVAASAPGESAVLIASFITFRGMNWCAEIKGVYQLLRI